MSNEWEGTGILGDFKQSWPPIGLRWWVHERKHWVGVKKEWPWKNLKLLCSFESYKATDRSKTSINPLLVLVNMMPNKEKKDTLGPGSIWELWRIIKNKKQEGMAPI